MRFTPEYLVAGGNMASTIYSTGVDLNQIVVYSIQAVFTGAPVGTLKLQVSNDIVSPVPNGGQASEVVNWTDYACSVTSVAAAGSQLFNCADVGYRWVRLVYTAASGTGTLNVTFSGKGF